MDVFSHAVAGACTGAFFGHPVLGAVAAASPDVMLIGKRKTNPPELYDATHSIAFLAILTSIGSLFGLGYLFFFSYLSHLLLDMPTHGKEWAPPLLWPFASKRYSYGTEWEFFNTSWKRGFFLTLLWSSIWLALLSNFGSPALQSVL